MAASTLILQKLKPILKKYAPGGRSNLLPALWEAQQAYGFLSEPIAAAIGRSLGVPLAEVYGVIAFYDLLYTEPVGRTLVRICVSPMCAQGGGRAILEALAAHWGVRPGETTGDGRYTLEAVPCLGLCNHAPAALFGEIPVRLDPTAPPSDWIERTSPLAPDRVDGEPRWLSGRCGTIPPGDLVAFEARGGFEGLKNALVRSPDQVIEVITQAGLTGRGGAAFPTGLKWQLTAEAEGTPKFVVGNADESEPGTFKDRVLMEGDPYQVLEGMVIAGYAVGAHRGYLYVRGEYFRARRTLQDAIEAARSAGYLGEDILGSGFAFDIELRSGAGAYVCGEETALIESIEGKRGYPRAKPPFPTTCGLFGSPTLVNNVETLCAVAWILARGAEAFRSVGTERSPGTKLFCISGDVARPGVYEMPLGTPLGVLLERAGGVAGELQGVLIGGAAGAFVGPEQGDLPLSLEHLRKSGLSLGSGAISVLNTERDRTAYLLSIAEFFAHESCGKCFPCQLGTQHQIEILKKLTRGEATSSDRVALEDVAFVMREASLCGLGQTASSAILSALHRWPELWSERERHDGTDSPTHDR